MRLVIPFAVLAPIALTLSPAQAQQAPEPKLSDAELARVTGKFVLPNGVELALSVTSDTVVNGQLILRTVLTVDRTTQLHVFGRNGQPAATSYTGSAGTAAAQATGVTIALDRKSGTQTLSPTFAVSRAPSVSVGGTVQDPTSLGLVAVPVIVDGPAIATADGAVSLHMVRGGSQVSFAGDQLAIVNLVGQSIASAVANSANDRTLDSVTNVSVDARNLAPYQIGAAQMRVDSLVTDATRRMIR